MTRKEAERAASALWGPPTFAARISSNDRAKRCAIGIKGPLSGEPLVLGYGETYEECFAHAAREGRDKEKVRELRELRKAETAFEQFLLAYANQEPPKSVAAINLKIRDILIALKQQGVSREDANAFTLELYNHWMTKLAASAVGVKAKA